MTKAVFEVIGFVPTSDLDRAIPFFRDVLGLEFVSHDEYAAVFGSDGQSVRVVAVGNFEAQSFTIIGWQTSDIHETTKDLAKKGLTFLRYPHFDQDDLGVWTAPSGARVAWFNDPDGNVLSFTELPHTP